MTSANPVDLEELEFELIDYGAEEVFKDEEDENVIVIYGAFESYGAIQKFIEENGYELKSGQFERIPTTELKKVAKEDRVELDKLIEKLENDDDVQNVYHLLDTSEE